jgi:hypothetical protein
MLELLNDLVQDGSHVALTTSLQLLSVLADVDLLQLLGILYHVLHCLVLLVLLHWLGVIDDITGHFQGQDVGLLMDSSLIQDVEHHVLGFLARRDPYLQEGDG